ncbi:radical S-adenosyl methionine domain-containing protein 1 [Coemansia sp. RSA 2599]|nr:radical S-adenosyl methionine domain-containing protein 1 [Coemansia sp. RSA 2599]
MSAAARLNKTPISLYVHWPYCTFLCKFCAFSKARVPQQGVQHERITNALIRELQTVLAPHRRDKELRSIYFGGGTPSLARPKHIAQIIERANALVPLASDAEITLESNPTLAEVDKMREFRAAGINRYSIGVQTLDDRTLASMGRLHTGADGLAAVDRAREIFPGKVTFDMIFGFAGQTLQQWESELETALDHADRHISVYQLTVEPGTPLFRDHRSRRVVLPDDDEQSRMYERAVEICRARGFRHYEVSSYAAGPDAESRHNKGYWLGQQYLGIGPSAHSRFVDPDSGRRLGSVRIPDTMRWMQACEGIGHGTARETSIGCAEAMQEAVVFGLRMMDGISDQRFKAVSGGRPLDRYLCMDRVHQFVEQGYLAWSQQGPGTSWLAPTERGLQVVDSILVDIIPSGVAD